MSTFKYAFIDPFQNKSQNLYLRIGRILFRFTIIVLIPLLGSLFVESRGLLNIIIEKLFFVSFALAGFFNLISGLKFGVMSHMTGRQSLPYPDIKVDRVNFWIHFFIHMFLVSGLTYIVFFE